MPGGDVAALQGVRVVEKVAELGERVTAHAGDGRPAAGVLGDEVSDHVAPEAVLQAHDVVRDAEPVRDELRVGDGVEGAARPVGDAVAVAEQLHRRADDVVPCLHEQRRGERRVDAPRHGDQYSVSPLALPARLRMSNCGLRIRPPTHQSAIRNPQSAIAQDHRCNTADRALTFSTIFGSAPITASTSSALLSLPKEKRSAAMPSSRGTPIAVSTCEGSIAPVLQADPEEQAMPARSRCMSSASLSVPGMATFETDRKSTRLNSSHLVISYAVFCLKKKKTAGAPLSSW